MEKAICSVCGKECVPNGISTGYGVNGKGKKFCYECCAKEDKKQLMSLEVGQKMCLYLTVEKDSRRGFVTNWPDGLKIPEGSRRGFVTNWPGSLKIPVVVWVGRHNLAGKRYDCQFRQGGHEFHATRYGDNSEICYVRKLRSRS